MPLEQEKRIKALEEENRKLREDLDKIMNYTTNLGGSLEFRNLVNECAESELSVSSKGVDTEDQTVNEAGAASYSVLKDPDGFLKVDIGVATYNLPYYE